MLKLKIDFYYNVMHFLLFCVTIKTHSFELIMEGNNKLTYVFYFYFMFGKQNPIQKSK